MANNYLEQLMQIFRGCVLDGDLISKHDRDQLVSAGLVEKAFGWNIITRKGIQYLYDLGVIKPGIRY